MDHPAHHHRHHHAPGEPSTARLAASATLHCLLGCAAGEAAGMAMGMALRLSNVATLALAVALGFVFGFALGVVPLLRAGFGWGRAAKQVLLSEGLSIAVMEATEVLVVVYTPGVMDAHFGQPVFWWGMAAALAAGFAAAYPVNYALIRRGVRHHHGA